MRDLLAAEHRALRQAVAGLSPEQLGEFDAKSKRTRGELIAGIAFHDVYHAGQIQLLKAMSRASRLPKTR
jgi:hypothetical protein